MPSRWPGFSPSQALRSTVEASDGLPREALRDEKRPSAGEGPCSGGFEVLLHPLGRGSHLSWEVKTNPRARQPVLQLQLSGLDAADEARQGLPADLDVGVLGVLAVTDAYRAV